MKIKIESKTKPERSRRAVRFDGQWANCSESFWQNAEKGLEYDVASVRDDGNGFKTLIETGVVSKPTAPVVNNDSEKMTKADWREKEKFIAKTAIMKSVLESPALAEYVKLQSTEDVAGPAMFLFEQCWKKFNEQAHEQV